jgi:hypothetical protein
LRRVTGAGNTKTSKGGSLKSLFLATLPPPRRVARAMSTDLREEANSEGPSLHFSGGGNLASTAGEASLVGLIKQKGKGEYTAITNSKGASS